MLINSPSVFLALESLIFSCIKIQKHFKPFIVTLLHLHIIIIVISFIIIIIISSSSSSNNSILMHLIVFLFHLTAGWKVDGFITDSLVANSFSHYDNYNYY